MRSAVESAVTELHMPAGSLGPEAVTSDVRCFAVPHRDGIVLVDTGPPGNTATIEATLSRIGASWSDVSDGVLTHAHLDHVGSVAADRVLFSHGAELANPTVALRTLVPVS